MEEVLRLLQDAVALTLALVAIALGVQIVVGNVRPLRAPLLRLVFGLLFLCAGVWIFYQGIRHIVAG